MVSSRREMFRFRTRGWILQLRVISTCYVIEKTPLESEGKQGQERFPSRFTVPKYDVSGMLFSVEFSRLTRIYEDRRLVRSVIIATHLGGDHGDTQECPHFRLLNTRESHTGLRRKIKSVLVTQVRESQGASHVKATNPFPWEYLSLSCWNDSPENLG